MELLLVNLKVQTLGKFLLKVDKEMVQDETIKEAQRTKNQRSKDQEILTTKEDKPKVTKIKSIKTQDTTKIQVTTKTQVTKTPLLSNLTMLLLLDTKTQDTKTQVTKTPLLFNTRTTKDKMLVTKTKLLPKTKPRPILTKPKEVKILALDPRRRRDQRRPTNKELKTKTNQPTKTKDKATKTNHVSPFLSFTT
jgi:hypothetical protein